MDIRGADLKMKTLNIIIILTIIGLIILFTEIISFENYTLIVQFPDTNYFTYFINSYSFMFLSVIFFMFLFPYLLIKNNGKRR